MKPLKLLAISASPRKDGNSRQFLTDTLKFLDDQMFPVNVTEYSFAGKKFGPCIGCLACYKNGGKCVINDDYEDLRQLWIASDIILYAFPVYALSMPGQMKCFIDRLGNSFYGHYEISYVRHLKVIGALAQGGVYMGGQEICNQSIMQHANLLSSVYTSGDGVHAGCGAIVGAGGNRNSLREKAASCDPGYAAELKMAQNTLKRMVEMAAILRAGVLGLKEKLSRDPRYLPALARMSEEE